MRFARDELAEAEAKLREQRARLSDFRRENRIVDPTADVAGQMGLLNALQGELAKAMVERDQLLSFVGPDDQRVLQADRRINAIDQRIDAERASLGASGADRRSPDMVGAYEELRSTSSSPTPPIPRRWPGSPPPRPRPGGSRATSRRTCEPTVAETSLYPRRALLSGLVLLFLTLGWGIVMLIYYNVRDNR